MRRKRVLVVLVAAVAITGVVLLVTKPWDDSHGDIEARRAIYEQFEPFPGSVKVSEDEYEIRADGRATGDFGLKVVFELPADASSTEVFDFFRSRAPTDWSVADDQTCVASLSGTVPPPPYTGPDAPPQATVPPPSAWVLINGRSQLTFLSPPASNLRNGVTFSLSREADTKLVTLDAAAYSCAPVPAVDSQADRFDQP